ncbi:MAG: hypothetical protein HYY16_07470 [Planctomycetes bacterium]|nr:hypothetical protein [Planctomycetota bacterium]
MRCLLSLAAVACIVGCGRAPVEKQEQAMQDLLFLHFDNLNNESEIEKFDAKRSSPAKDVVPPLGLTFSTYMWHPQGVILSNVRCAACEARHPVLVYRSEPLACTVCGSPDRDKASGKMTAPLVRGQLQRPDLEAAFGKNNVKAMFERVSAEKGDLVAAVRYVRREWVFDDRASVVINPKALETTPADSLQKPDSYFSGGFHRLDAAYVATTLFMYDGDLNQIDRDTVARYLASENGVLPEAKTWRVGPAVAVEEPIRPWNAPRLGARSF